MNYTLKQIKSTSHKDIRVFGNDVKFWVYKIKQEYPANIVNDIFGINESKKLSIYIGIESIVYLLH